MKSKKKKRYQSRISHKSAATQLKYLPGPRIDREGLRARGGGGEHLGFFGWICAAWESKLAPRSKKNSPKIDTPF